MASARIHRLKAVAEENLRLRQLLGGTRGYNLKVRMAGILDIDLDPFRQRLVLDAGSDSGVEVGQAVIDSGGVLGPDHGGDQEPCDRPAGDRSRPRRAGAGGPLRRAHDRLRHRS